MRGYRGASGGFPLAWEEESDAVLAPASTLPYAPEAIEKYLEDSHYHVCLKEPPTRFSFLGVVGEREISGRRYWAAQARDEADRVWFVLIGSGVSCLRPDRFMRRWMVGMQPDGTLGVDQMFEAQIEDQMEHDQRCRGSLE
jgi:hypothetical protein